MVLAELEFFHSRPIAPTRRVALGDSNLPVDPAPGFGGILLGGILAAGARQIDEDFLPDLARLVTELEEGRRIPQPRLRYRFQKDRVGLLRSRQRLVTAGERIEYVFDEERSTAEQRVLAAVYAAGAIDDPEARLSVMTALRRALRWEGSIGPSLIANLSGTATGHQLPTYAFEHPVEWALDILGFAAPTNGHGPPPDRLPADDEVQSLFRVLLRRAHPDHGGAVDDAAQRIADLREARRILLT
jgi:hypothetical protein